MDTRPTKRQKMTETDIALNVVGPVKEIVEVLPQSEVATHTAIAEEEDVPEKEPTLAHYEAVLTKLGQVNYLTLKTAHIFSDATHMDKLSTHPYNRQIDPKWVEETMDYINTVDSRGDWVGDLLVGILYEDIKAWANGDMNFTVKIIDGQHRHAAIQKLRKYNPNFNCKVSLKVLVLESDIALSNEIENCNKRKPFDQKQFNDVNAKKLFIETLKEILGIHSRHIFAKNIMNKIDILNDPKFLNKIYGKSSTEICSKLTFIGNQQKYIDRFESMKLKPTRVLAKTIYTTKLYQLCDETCAWMYEM